MPREPKASSVKSADAAACSLARVLGSRIRQLYVTQKAASLRRPFRLSTKDSDGELWRKAGAICRDMEVNPEVFIEALFQYSDNPQGPFPNALTGDHARKCVREYKSLWMTSVRDEGVDISLLPTQSVEHEIRDLASFLKKTCGTEDLNNEKVKFQLRAHHTAIRAHIRCFMMPYDDEVVHEFGLEAQTFLRQHPQECNALMALNPAAVQMILSYENGR